MLNVLIITYYFPPCNGVQGWRPYSWYKYFPEFKINTTVITRHWIGNETVWDDSIKENLEEKVIEENEYSRIIRLPYYHSFLKKVADHPLLKIKLLSKVFYLTIKLLGRFAIEVDASKSFAEHASAYIKKNKVDLILISAPPQNLIRLGYELSEKYAIPYVIDFRDLWDNDELKKGYNPGFSMRLHNLISKKYIKKWIREAAFVTTVSQPLVEKIKELTERNVVEITNGFEKELFKGKTTIPETAFFTISIIGSIYAKQDLSIILNGLNKFIAVAGKQQVRLNFIGIKTIEAVAEQIRTTLPPECIFLSERVPRETAIQYTFESHVLLYAGWKDYEGIYSGKIFDYIGAGRNILIAPGDDNVIDNIVLNSRAGKVANSVDEFYTYLMDWFTEWKKSGKLTYHGEEEVINKYTRENQAKILAQYIVSMFNTSQATVDDKS